MKKWTGLFVFILGGLFAYAMIARPYERNYIIDEEAGMKNIMSKIEDLAGDNSVYAITIASEKEQSDMDFLTLFVADTEKETNQKIKFNRSGAFHNSVDKEELSYSSRGKNWVDISKLSNILNFIDECKKSIPEGYKYRHTEYISVENGRMSIRIAVAPENKNNRLKSKYVYRETYTKIQYSGGRRGRTSSRSVHCEYYVMKFNIDEDGTVSQK
jgi:hypothetical protein